MSALRIGSCFASDYQVVRQLGEGGMGAVYEVTQLSTGKSRALKVMQPELVANASLRARFEQEARIGSRIASEHVVEVIAAGVDGVTGYPFIIMELLEGEDFAAHVSRRGPLPPDELLGVFEQICHGAGAAHAAGIVHRDLKPNNIFLSVSRHSRAGLNVKLLDFGIAKIAADGESSGKSTAALGTPLFMAPEQTERGVVSPAADVWALGLIAFWALTGRSYWRAGNDDSPTVAQLMREVLFSSLPPASSRARELGQSVPPWFDAWFERAVCRHVESRFSNATQAWEAMKSAATVVAESPTTLVPRAAPVQPSRVWLAVASGVVAALVIGGTVAAGMSHEGPRAPLDEHATPSRATTSPQTHALVPSFTPEAQGAPKDAAIATDARAPSNEALERAEKLHRLHKDEQARLILEPRVFSNIASEDEIRLLGAICKAQRDEVCEEACDARLFRLNPDRYSR